MTIRRAIPDVQSDDVESIRSFYAGLIGFDVSMEEGNFLLFSSPVSPDVQVSLNETPGDAPALPGFAVDVGTADRVTEIHEAAVTQGLTITEPLDDKPWGIRRFGLLDPSGVRVSVIAHV